MHSEAELLSARLTRLKDIVDSLEAECEASGAPQRKFNGKRRTETTSRCNGSSADLLQSPHSAGRTSPIGADSTASAIASNGVGSALTMTRRAPADLASGTAPATG